jgi:hypothetical protein
MYDTPGVCLEELWKVGEDHRDENRLSGGDSANLLNDPNSNLAKANDFTFFPPYYVFILLSHECFGFIRLRIGTIGALLCKW